MAPLDFYALRRYPISMPTSRARRRCRSAASSCLRAGQLFEFDVPPSSVAGVRASPYHYLGCVLDDALGAGRRQEHAHRRHQRGRHQAARHDVRIRPPETRRLLHDQRRAVLGHRRRLRHVDRQARSKVRSVGKSPCCPTSSRRATARSFRRGWPERRLRRGGFPERCSSARRRSPARAHRWAIG